jgi:hypothetical protein
MDYRKMCAASAFRYLRHLIWEINPLTGVIQSRALWLGSLL